MKKYARNIVNPSWPVRSLAVAIVLQCVEDLWGEGQRKECLRFFRGSGFTVCAEIAGMDVSGRGKLLCLVGRLTGRIC